MKYKTIFLIVWKSWKNYKIFLFHNTKDAWNYVVKHDIKSYSIHWSNESIQVLTSQASVKKHIEELLRENPDVQVSSVIREVNK